MMTAAVTYPFVKLLITALAVLVAATVAVALLCRFFNRKRTLPLIFTTAAVVLVFFPLLWQSMKDVLLIIFR